MVVGLNHPQADREARHGIAKGLNDGSTVRLSGHLRRREEEYRSSDTIYDIDIVGESYDHQKVLGFCSVRMTAAACHVDNAELGKQFDNFSQLQGFRHN